MIETRIWLPAFEDWEFGGEFFLGKRDATIPPVKELVRWMQANIQDCVLAAMKRAAPAMESKNGEGYFAYRFVFCHTSEVGPEGHRIEVRRMSEGALAVMVEPFLTAMERTLSAEELVQFQTFVAEMHINIPTAVSSRAS